MFQQDPPTLVKDKAGQAGNQPTKYADLAQVNRVVLSRLNKLGVIFVGKPTLCEVGAEWKFCLKYRLTHIKSGEKEEGLYPLPVNENPQRMGSAISYSRRYVLNALTGVAAEDEDDDGATRPRTAQRQAKPRSQASRPDTTGQGPATAQRGAGQAGPPLPSEGATLSAAQRAKIGAMFNGTGMTNRVERLTVTSSIIGREIGSADELTGAEAHQVIGVLIEAEKSGEAYEYLLRYLPEAPPTDGQGS